MHLAGHLEVRRTSPDGQNEESDEGAPCCSHIPHLDVGENGDGGTSRPRPLPTTFSTLYRRQVKGRLTEHSNATCSNCNIVNNLTSTEPQRRRVSQIHLAAGEPRTASDQPKPLSVIFKSCLIDRILQLIVIRGLFYLTVDLLTEYRY